MDGQVGCALWKSSFGCCVENLLPGVRPAKRPRRSVAQDQGGHSIVGVSVGGLSTWAGRGPSRRGPWKGCVGSVRPNGPDFWLFSNVPSTLLFLCYYWGKFSELLFPNLHLTSLSLTFPKSRIFISGGLDLPSSFWSPTPQNGPGACPAWHLLQSAVSVLLTLSDNLPVGYHCLCFSEESLSQISNCNLIAYISYFSCWL